MNYADMKIKKLQSKRELYDQGIIQRVCFPTIGSDRQIGKYPRIPIPLRSIIYGSKYLQKEGKPAAGKIYIPELFQNNITVLYQERTVKSGGGLIYQSRTRLRQAFNRVKTHLLVPENPRSEGTVSKIWLPDDIQILTSFSREQAAQNQG